MERRRGAEHRNGGESVYLYLYLGSGPEAVEMREQLKMKNQKRGQLARWLRKQVMLYLREAL